MTHKYRKQGLDEFSKIAMKLADTEAELRDLIQTFIEHREDLSRAERTRLAVEAEQLLGVLSNGELREELQSFKDQLALHKRLR